MAAQHLYMGVHGAVLDKIVIMPHILQNFFAAQRQPLVGGQIHQQIEFLGGERHFFSGNVHGVAGNVDAQLAEHKSVAAFGSFGHGAGEHGLYPGHKLTRAEGLYHIVIGTAFQPGKLVIFLAAGGEHDHGGLDMACAHFAQAGHAVHKRHHNIQNHQVSPFRAKGGQGGAAITCFAAGEAGKFQMLADQFANALLIVNDQNGGHSVYPPYIIQTVYFGAALCGPAQNFIL